MKPISITLIPSDGELFNSCRLGRSAGANYFKATGFRSAGKHFNYLCQSTESRIKAHLKATSRGAIIPTPPACCVLCNVITLLMKTAFPAFRCLLGAACVVITVAGANPEPQIRLQVILLAEANTRFLLLRLHPRFPGHKWLLLPRSGVESSVSESNILFLPGAHLKKRKF